mgnify:CR=1 FL=1
MNGNENVSLNEILYLVRQRPPNFFFRRPKFNPRLLKLDAITLKSYYHSKGFLDVEIKDSYASENDLIDIKFDKILKVPRGNTHIIFLHLKNQIDRKMKRQMHSLNSIR